MKKGNWEDIKLIISLCFTIGFVVGFVWLLVILSKGSTPKSCDTYKHEVLLCRTGFNCYFYTDSIWWENNMLLAIDHYGVKRMVNPLGVKEGEFKHCIY